LPIVSFPSDRGGFFEIPRPLSSHSHRGTTVPPRTPSPFLGGATPRPERVLNQPSPARRHDDIHSPQSYSHLQLNPHNSRPADSAIQQPTPHYPRNPSLSDSDSSDVPEPIMPTGTHYSASSSRRQSAYNPRTPSRNPQAAVLSDSSDDEPRIIPPHMGGSRSRRHSDASSATVTTVPAAVLDEPRYGFGGGTIRHGGISPAARSRQSMGMPNHDPPRYEPPRSPISRAGSRLATGDPIDNMLGGRRSPFYGDASAGGGGMSGPIPSPMRSTHGLPDDGMPTRTPARSTRTIGSQGEDYMMSGLPPNATPFVPARPPPGFVSKLHTPAVGGLQHLNSGGGGSGLTPRGGLGASGVPLPNTPQFPQSLTERWMGIALPPSVAPSIQNLNSTPWHPSQHRLQDEGSPRPSSRGLPEFSGPLQRPLGIRS
jgi:hypothetical protein